MAKNINLVIAGFGGQGALFAGKVAAYAGLLDGKNVSWLPSYGPEMRGGTANCSICISSEAVGSPQVLEPNAFIAMNLPSFDKFIDAVEPGGIAIADSTMIAKKTDRTDIRTIYLPASTLAEENGLKGLTNLILIGRLFREVSFCTKESLIKAIEKSVPAHKASLLESNIKALELGIQTI